jgi:hypothetical protein
MAPEPKSELLFQKIETMTIILRIHKNECIFLGNICYAVGIFDVICSFKRVALNFTMTYVIFNDNV